MEFQDLLTYIFRLLLAVGAIASAVFVIDYLRTADLGSPFARMSLTLNAAIAVVLSVSLGAQFFTLSVVWSLILLVALIFVDMMLIYQIIALHKARKSNRDRIL